MVHSRVDPLAAGDMADVKFDAFHFARGAGRRSGRIPVARFERLCAAGVRPEGELTVELRGGETDGKPWLQIVVAGELKMVCQRCLEVLAVSLAIDNRLMVRATASDQHDDAEWTVEDIDDELIGSGPLDIGDVVEDEILLEIPMVALHDACDEASGAAVGQQKSSPFAALQALRRVN